MQFIKVTDKETGGNVFIKIWEIRSIGTLEGNAFVEFGTFSPCFVFVVENVDEVLQKLENYNDFKVF